MKFTEEHKRKIGLANKGKKRPDISKRNKSLWMRNIARKANLGRKRLDFSGENHWKYNGGKTIAGKYKMIYKPEHPFANRHGYIREHRFIMEQQIGRYLKPQERVHHINGIHQDNRAENLRLFNDTSEHSKFHHPKGSKFNK